ncbi:MAG: hypothetical protein AMXMBFR82_37680 [Candidatus Hydrogenedentota bacterium]
MNKPLERKRPGEATRSRILDAAELLFTTHGYDGTSTRAIADAAPANIGLLAYYFGSKEGLFRAVVARWVEKTMDYFNQSINKNTDTAQSLGDLLKCLAQISQPVMALAVRESLVCAHTPVSQAVTSLLEAPRLHIQELIAAGIQQGRFKPVDSGAFYRAAMGALATASTASTPTGGLVQNSAIDFAVELLVAGIRLDATGPLTATPAADGGRSGSGSGHSTATSPEEDEDPFEIGMID